MEHYNAFLQRQNPIIDPIDDTPPDHLLALYRRFNLGTPDPEIFPEILKTWQRLDKIPLFLTDPNAFFNPFIDLLVSSFSIQYQLREAFRNSRSPSIYLSILSIYHSLYIATRDHLLNKLPPLYSNGLLHEEISHDTLSIMASTYKQFFTFPLQHRVVHPLFTFSKFDQVHFPLVIYINSRPSIPQEFKSTKDLYGYLSDAINYQKTLKDTPPK